MRFRTDAEVWSVVEKFEQCEFSLAEFDHANHLAVGLAYLSESGFDEALTRMRSALKRFSGHHGKQGYHETITRFWLMKLAEIPGNGALWERVNRAAELLADKELIFQYYEREVLLSAEARERWVLPQRLKLICS